MVKPQKSSKQSWTTGEKLLTIALLSVVLLFAIIWQFFRLRDVDLLQENEPALRVIRQGFAFSCQYRRIGKSYLLYSLGPDGKDDGGKSPAYSRPGGPGHVLLSMTKEAFGDFVAGVDRR